MKWIHILLIGTLLLCSSGIVSAANNSSSSMTLFTDANVATAENVITNSGMGDVFALISVVVLIVIWVAPVVLLVIALAALAMGKHDLYKFAIRGFLLMAVVLTLYNLYVAFIGSLTPDISTIPI